MTAVFSNITYNQQFSTCYRVFEKIYIYLSISRKYRFPQTRKKLTSHAQIISALDCNFGCLHKNIEHLERESFLLVGVTTVILWTELLCSLYFPSPLQFTHPSCKRSNLNTHLRKFSQWDFKQAADMEVWTNQGRGREPSQQRATMIPPI